MMRLFADCSGHVWLQVYNANVSSCGLELGGIHTCGCLPKMVNVTLWG